MSELVRAYKQHYNPGGSEGLDDYMRKVVAKCVIYLWGLKRMCVGMKVAHNRRDRSEDVNALLDFLLNDGLESKRGYICMAGRYHYSPTIPDIEVATFIITETENPKNLPLMTAHSFIFVARSRVS